MIEQKIDIYPWNIVDTSPRGYRVAYEVDNKTPLSIGELLLIKPIEEFEVDQSLTWKLATVCWMEVSLHSHEVNMGLHVIGDTVRRIHVSRQFRGKGSFEDCLLLDASSKTESASILMSRHYANTGDELFIKAQQKVYKICIDDAVWYSDGFTQFHFHLLSMPEDIN